MFDIILFRWYFSTGFNDQYHLVNHEWGDPMISGLKARHLRSNGNGYTIVCSSTMQPTRGDINNILKELLNLDYVFRVGEGSEDDRFTFTATFENGTTDAQKEQFRTLVDAKYVFGRAWGKVLRDGNTHQQIGTFVRIDAERWTEPVLRQKLETGSFDEIADYDFEVNRDGGTGLLFTPKVITRKNAANQKFVADVAKKLGITLEKDDFTIEDSAVYSLQVACRHPEDTD